MLNISLVKIYKSPVLTNDYRSLPCCQYCASLCDKNLWIPADSGIQQAVQSLDSLRKLTMDSWLCWFYYPEQFFANLPDFLYVLLNFLKFYVQNLYVLRVVKHILFKSQYFYLKTSSNLYGSSQWKELLFFLSHLKGKGHNTPSPLNILFCIFYITTIHLSK